MVNCLKVLSHVNRVLQLDIFTQQTTVNFMLHFRFPKLLFHERVKRKNARKTVSDEKIKCFKSSSHKTTEQLRPQPPQLLAKWSSEKIIKQQRALSRTMMNCLEKIDRHEAGGRWEKKWMERKKCFDMSSQPNKRNSKNTTHRTKRQIGNDKRTEKSGRKKPGKECVVMCLFRFLFFVLSCF